MRNFIFAATAAAVVAMSGVALADPTDTPTNNGIQAVDCGGLFVGETSDEPKNIGQAQQVIRNNPTIFGDANNNLAQLGVDLEVENVGEFMQKNLFICGLVSDPS